MAERLNIEAESRTTFGKKSKRLRREGMVPAVIYGKRDPVHIQIENLPLRRALRHAGGNDLIDINLSGNKVTVLAREIQQHPTRGDLIHVDFYEVDMQQTIEATVRLITVGQAAEELRQMGQVVQVLHEVSVEALPGDLISEMEVDISGIASVDDVIYVSELTAPAGVTILTEPETAITSFDYFREEEEEEEEEEMLFAEEGEEVEVISKGKAAEEDETEEEDEG